MIKKFVVEVDMSKDFNEKTLLSVLKWEEIKVKRVEEMFTFDQLLEKNQSKWYKKIKKESK